MPKFPEDISYVELVKLKDTWLKEHEPYLMDLVQATFTAGVSTSIDAPGYTNRNVHVATEQELTVQVFPSTGKFITDANDFDHKFIANIYFKDYKVCHFQYTTDPDLQESAKQESFFVPGNWMTLANRIIVKANSIEAHAKRDAEKEAQQELIRKLLLGIDV